LRQVQELEPDIDPVTIGDAPVAFFPEEGWLDPVVYAHAMLSAARLRHGAKFICGARVVVLIMAGDRVTGVRVAEWTAQVLAFLQGLLTGRFAGLGGRLAAPGKSGIRALFFIGRTSRLMMVAFRHGNSGRRNR
jgi:glycine/D-amino acid oxidase-like deaminating enzyme